MPFGAPAALAAEPMLSFSAKEAEADPRAVELRLRGGVVVGIDRFRLTSDELVLRELSDGVAVDGPARVTFCDCLRAPLAIGFERAVVREPGDLKLEHPSLQVGGVTVLALPWFWLRAPSQPGLLPPKIAYRGADGLLLGAGVHLPWSRGESALDLGLAGYTRGGFELTTSLRTPSSNGRLRWDHLRGDLVAASAAGSTELANSTALSWEIDAIRGPRARTGTIELEPAARAYDRAAVESATRVGPIIVATGARALGARGNSGPGSGHSWGPRLSLISGTALGADAEWDALAIGEVLAGAEPLHVARAESGIAASLRPGPFATRFSARESLLVVASQERAGLDATLAARAEAGLPLVRELGPADAELVHFVEPRAEVIGLVSRASGAVFDELPALRVSGRAALASAGFRTALGPRFSASGGSVEAALGMHVPGATNHPEPLARYRAGWDSRHLGLSGEGATSLEETKRGHVLLTRARLGAKDASYLAFQVAGRSGIEPVAARMLTTSGLQLASGGWLAAPGWSAGSEVGSWLFRVIRLQAGADADLSERRLLGVRTMAGYRHPCGCLAASLYGQQRLGREGVDVWASVELSP